MSIDLTRLNELDHAVWRVHRSRLTLKTGRFGGQLNAPCSSWIEFCPYGGRYLDVHLSHAFERVRSRRLEGTSISANTKNWPFWRPTERSMFELDRVLPVWGEVPRRPSISRV